MPFPVCLDGRQLARDLEARLSQRHLHQPPVLAILQVGEEAASSTYARMKIKACQRVGIDVVMEHVPASFSTRQVLSLLEKWNQNPAISGIMMEHPVPPHINERECFDAIHPAKDVDGANAISFGRLSMGDPAFGSATPSGIMHLLRHYHIEVEGKEAVVLGRSAILGRPMAAMLINAHATVTICHSRTQHLPDIVRRADIVVAAVHRERFVQADWVKPGAVVVDAGFHASGHGDVEMAPVIQRCSAYTPVPGGVGPMTVITLLMHTVAAAQGSFLPE